LRRTLQLEGITSLNLAVERAKAVKIIQGESFVGKKENFGRFNKNSERGDYQKAERNDARKENGEKKNEEKKRENPPGGRWRRNNFSSKRKECWTCGKAGHFRAECPEERGNAV